MHIIPLTTIPLTRCLLSPPAKTITFLWLLVVVGMTAIPAVNGATIALTNSDVLGTSSFNTGGNWSGGAAPTAGHPPPTSPIRVSFPSKSSHIPLPGDSLGKQGRGGGLRRKKTPTGTSAHL